MTIEQRIKKQMKENATETALGEPQTWIYLQTGRTIEVCFESYNLPINKCFYSIRLHCTDDEFDKNIFKNTCGIVDSIVTPNCKIEDLTYVIQAIKGIILRNNEIL